MSTISLDFDGVIHLYSKGWHDGTVYDTNIEGSISTINHLLFNNYSVFILSSRNVNQIKEWIDFRYPEIRTEIIPEHVKFWNKKNVLGITNRKLPANVYIDDRALTFEGKFNDAFLQKIENFKTWQEIAKIPKKICPNKDSNGSCPLHNLHCSYPACEK